MKVGERISKFCSDNSEAIWVFVVIIVIVGSGVGIHLSESAKTTREYEQFAPFRVEFEGLPVADRQGNITNLWIRTTDLGGKAVIAPYKPWLDGRIPGRIRATGAPRGSSNFAVQVLQDVGPGDRRYIEVRPPLRSERNWERSPSGGDGFPRFIVDVHLHHGELPQSYPGQHQEGEAMVED